MIVSLIMANSGSNRFQGYAFSKEDVKSFLLSHIGSVGSKKASYAHIFYINCTVYRHTDYMCVNRVDE